MYSKSFRESQELKETESGGKNLLTNENEIGLISIYSNSEHECLIENEK